MALDFFAIASGGSYPTPTPTGAARAAYAVTRGLLGLVPAFVAGVGARRSRFRFGFRKMFR